jgi:hypothetical protein
MESGMENPKEIVLVSSEDKKPMVGQMNRVYPNEKAMLCHDDSCQKPAQI